MVTRHPGSVALPLGLWESHADTQPALTRGVRSVSPVERSTVGQRINYVTLPRNAWRDHGFTCATCGMPAVDRFRDGSPRFGPAHSHAPLYR